MADNQTGGRFRYEVDDRDMMVLLKRVQGVEKELRKDINGRIRRAGKASAEVLVQDLRQAAAYGPPQAVAVSRSVRALSDRVPKVSIGGKRKRDATSRGTTAGMLLWGSERGSSGAPDIEGNVRNRFVKPHNASGYWIRPTVNRFIDTKAFKAYERAVLDILKAEGLL